MGPQTNHFNRASRAAIIDTLKVNSSGIHLKLIAVDTDFLYLRPFVCHVHYHHVKMSSLSNHFCRVSRATKIDILIVNPSGIYLRLIAVDSDWLSFPFY